MSRYKRKPLAKRRIFTIGELAARYGVHRHTMRHWMQEFGGLELRDAGAVLDFAAWVKGKAANG